MSNVMDVTDQNFEAEVLQSDVPVLVDFYATWCGPCKSLAPIVDEIARDYDGKVKVAKVDIDRAPGVASSHGIMAVPTLILFKDGAEARKMTGFKARPELDAAIQAVL